MKPTIQTTRPARPFPRPLPESRGFRLPGLSWVLASETFASLLGFAAIVRQAHLLGPSAFASFEYAAAVFAWLLVLVRGGFDVIVYREAARRPRLIPAFTDLLLGLRLIAAVVGFAIVGAVAAIVGPERGAVVALAGLGLFASACAADVGVRARGRLGWLAGAQMLRAVGYLGAVVLLVREPGDALAASGCLVVAETLVAGVFLALHVHDHGLPAPRFRRRATLILARRGGVAGLSRFARVTVYGADLLALGWWTASDLAPYAAARRLVYALVALGLVIPAVFGPDVARAWAAGRRPARDRISLLLAGLWAFSLPAALGLALQSPRLMPALFGPDFAHAAPWLALVAARLPWLLAASFNQAALTACRREDAALRVVALQAGLALVLIPAGVFLAGPRGAAWAALTVEATGAIGSWVVLARLGIAPRWAEQVGRPLVGSLGLIAACRVSAAAPLPLTCLAGAFGYAAAYRFACRLAPTPVSP